MRRVLIVVDVYGWAWDYMAQGIASGSPDDVAVTILDQNDFNSLATRMPWALKSFDGISQCSWPESLTNLPDVRKTVWLASHGFDFPWPPIEDAYPALIATPNRNTASAARILPRFDKVLCVSHRLKDSLDSVKWSDGRAVRVCPGIDHKTFRQFPLPNRDKLIIGWCGQRAGVTKGFHTALKSLQKELGDLAEWQVNCRSAADPLSRDEMVAWYRGLDLFISTSSSEGFQMPLLEAASCGRPILATDVGAAKELIVEDDNGFLITPYQFRHDVDRTVSEFVQHIRRYHKDRGMLKRHAEQSRKIVEQGFTWERHAPRWLETML